MNNEELQQFVIDTLGGCVWDMDLKQERINYSDEFLALLGYEPGEREITTEFVADNIHPKDLPLWHEAFLRSIKGESQHFDCELRYKHKEDYYVWIQTRGAVVERNSEGRALRISGIVFDIGERKAFKENESRYRLFLDNIPDAISLKDRDGRYLYINRQFESWIGKPSYQIHGYTADEIFDSDHEELADLREHERRVWESGETVSMERVFPRTEDGLTRHAVITKFPVFDEAGRILAIGTTNTDVSARFRAQEELRASEQRYKRLFEMAPAVLAESDWSAARGLVDRLRDEGVEDLRQHLIDHPELMPERQSLVRVVSVNREALRVYQADNQEDLLRKVNGAMSETERLAMIEDIVNFAIGQRRSVVKTRTTRASGEEFPVITETEIYAGSLDDWSQVMLTVRDTSGEEAVLRSEVRYRQLFEAAPAVLTECDWTPARMLVDRLRQDGVEDIREHLLHHPELLVRQDQVMRVLNVNHEALDVFQAEDTQGLIDYVHSEINQMQRELLINEIAAFAAGETRVTNRSRHYKLNGQEFPVVRVCERYGADPDDWSQVLITIRDTSAEEAVRMSEVRYRRLFESAPVPLFESDWSRGRELVASLHSQGVRNIESYLLEHPELITRRDDIMRETSFNDEALNVYRVADEQQLFRFIEGEIDDDQRRALIKSMQSFASGMRRSSLRTIGRRADGERFHLVRSSELISSDRDDWSRVLTSIHDLTAEVEAAERLRQYQEELRSLAGKISLAEEGERRRISSELHDGTIQNLVLARIHLASLKNNLQTDGVELADSINELLESSLSETRSLIFEISPPVLYELGLEPAVEWLADHYRQRHGLDVIVTGDHGETRLSEELNIVVFQAARELLVNVVKHAQASRVEINWSHGGDRVELSISDDGIGFDVGSESVRRASEGGFGLFSIRERLKLLGADIEFTSSPRGTRIRISAPV